MCVYIYNGILCSLEKEINFAICNDRDDVEGIMLSEISQIKTNIVYCIVLYIVYIFPYIWNLKNTTN